MASRKLLDELNKAIAMDLRATIQYIHVAARDGLGSGRHRGEKRF
jgi:hypothetical protein